jgi:uncharacterized protein YbjT (DUF2867 family)
MTVLVTGATGYVGGRLVPRLLQRGLDVRCMVRSPERLDWARWEDARHEGGATLQLVRGDALDPQSLGPALQGCRVAYYLIHSMAGGEQGFAERDREAARNFGQAAAAAGIEQIVYVGGLGDGDGELSRHLASRHQTGEILRASGVPITELRAAVVVGAGSVSFEMIRYLVDRLPVLVAPRWTTPRCQPIAIGDLLSYLLAVLDEPRARGRVLEIGGVDVLTYGEMMLGYARVRGLRRAIINVPVLTPRLSSLWVDLVTPIPAAFARPLIDGLRTEVVVRDDEARRMFPQIEPLGYERSVSIALERRGSGAAETVWSGSSSSAFDRAPASVEMHTLEGLIVERRERHVDAQPEQVFSIIEGLGGQRGWLYADWIWSVRGLLDRLMGGVGMRRSRRDPDRLRAGDACDFWRVDRVDRGPEHWELLLAAEMKVPGRAWLQLRAEPRPGGTWLTTNAIFEPRGLAGLLYWYVLYPVHRIIFSGLVRRIAEHAEGQRRDESGTAAASSGG